MCVCVCVCECVCVCACMRACVCVKAIVFFMLILFLKTLPDPVVIYGGRHCLLSSGDDWKSGDEDGRGAGIVIRKRKDGKVKVCMWPCLLLLVNKDKDFLLICDTLHLCFEY